MGLKCKIVYSGEGIANVFGENGEPSALYSNALIDTGNQEQALNLWATAYTEDFQDKTQLSPENVSISGILTYLDNRDLEAVGDGMGLSSREIQEVVTFMRENGFESLSDLSGELNYIFKGKGYFEVDANRMINSKLYSVDDVNSLDYSAMDKIISKIEAQLIKTEIYIDPQTPPKNLQFKDDINKTILGTSSTISEEEIMVELFKEISDFQNKEQVFNAISNLPYSEFVEKFDTDQRFNSRIIDRLSNLRKVPRMFLSVDGQNLSNDNLGTFTTLKNTLLDGIDPIEIESDIEYLETISPTVWSNKLNNIRQILKGIERTAVSYNVDVIGLSDNASNRPAVMDLLQKMDDMLLLPTTANIQNFAQAKDLLIPPSVINSKVSSKIPQSYQGLTIVSLDTNFSDEVLFSKYNLVKVGDGLYHMVQPTPINRMYDYIYEEFVEDRMPISREYFSTEFPRDPQNRQQTLSDLRNYVNSRDTGIYAPNGQEQISLTQLVFQHEPLVKPSLSSVNTLETSAEYLKTEFISDFYNNYLQEKLNDTEVYRKILSNFTVLDNDITILEDYLPNIEGIKYEKELKDYAKIRKESPLKVTLTDSAEVVQEDIQAINNPETVKEVQGKFALDGNYVTTPSSVDTWIRVGDNIYRKVLNSDLSSVYAKVAIEQNPVYFDTNTNFEINRSQVNEVQKTYEGAMTKTPQETFVANNLYSNNELDSINEKVDNCG